MKDHGHGHPVLEGGGDKVLGYIYPFKSALKITSVVTVKFMNVS